MRVDLRTGTRQVVTVNHTRGYHARVDALGASSDGQWGQRFQTTDGRIGYGGLVRPQAARAGHRQDPARHLPAAVGVRHARRSTTAGTCSYRRIRNGDYWVQDNHSDYYNRYRNKAQGGFRWWLPASHPNASERLKDFPRSTSSRSSPASTRGQVRHRGGAIFLHVNGSGATAGCVQRPARFMRRLMVRLDQDRVPLIAIGR